MSLTYVFKKLSEPMLRLSYFTPLGYSPIFCYTISTNRELLSTPLYFLKSISYLIRYINIKKLIF